MRLNPTRSWLLAMIGAVGLCGCAAKPVPVHTAVRIEKPLSTLQPRFFVDGRPVTEVRNVAEQPFEYWEFSADGSIRGEDFVAPNVTAHIGLPCGRKEIHVPLQSGGDWKVITADAKAGHLSRLDYSMDRVADFATLLPVTIDNRNGEAGELKIGEMAFAISAHTTERVDAFVPVCPSAPVRFHGQELGAIAANVLATEPESMVWIDPEDHCYTFRTLIYAVGGYGEQPKPMRLAGAHVYLLPTFRVHAFEGPPPSSFTSQDQFASYSSLTDSRCR